MRRFSFWLLALLALPAVAAELKIDFSEFHLDQTPPGFRSTLMGQGKPGDWQIIMDDVPPLLPPLTPDAPVFSKRPVLAQLAQDTTDEHFPMLIYDGEIFEDFTLTTRFKTVHGTKEQMAGIAFRIQNETNYYVLRASSLGNNCRFYKVVNGARGNPFGPAVGLPAGVWHELSIECKGNQINLQLDGRALIGTLNDDSFARGKIGFWTKSDSVSYFADTKVVYKPREAPAQVLVRAVAKKYPHLLGLEIYVQGKDTNTLRLAAGKDETEIGKPGGATELNVLRKGLIYYGKDKGSVAVTLPLRDRNGDIMAVVRVVTKPFAGETEETAIVRATPILKEIQGQAQSLEDLLLAD
jgi:hypothetical protein